MSGGGMEYWSNGVLEWGKLRAQRFFRHPNTPSSRRRRGFTLIELLLATAIMASIMAAVLLTWNTGLAALKRSRDLTENLQRQRALMDILSRSFRTAMFSQINAVWYAWDTQDNADADSVSFVATDVPAIGGLPQSGGVPQRIQFSLEPDPDDPSKMALMARVKNFLAYDLDNAGQTIRIANWVKSFNLRYYDQPNDQWLDTWDDATTMPPALELTITMASSNPTQGDVSLVKIIDIPCTGAAQIGAVPKGAGSTTTNRTSRSTTSTGSSGTTGSSSGS